MKRKKIPMNISINITMLILAVLIIPASILIRRGAVLYKAMQQETIYENIYICGVKVGGLTKTEASALLHETYQPLLDKKRINLTDGENNLAAFSFQDFEAQYDFTRLAEMAYAYGRTGPVLTRYKKISNLTRAPYEITQPPDYTFNEALVTKRIKKEAEKLFVPPVNASMSFVNQKIYIKPETEGRAPGLELMLEQTRELLSQQREGTVSITYKPVAPAYSVKDFEFKKSQIGHFKTELTDLQNGPRINNVRIAAEKMNDRVVYPGETFSAAALLGASTPENGYERAIVLVKGQPVEDYGGGICQVVTTLYNAVLYAELPVTERFNHSAGVSYADYGFDATVAGDYFDLKFKNNTPHPLLITCGLTEVGLVVDLYGFEIHNPGRELKFQSVLAEVIPPAPEKVLVDKNLPSGSAIVTTEARDGYRYELYKFIYENGKEVGKEKVNTSVYKPVQGVVSIGE